jgi:TRAP-type uncharacterized transport system fused permease subunit
VRLGIVAYIAPFLIVYRPELVLHGEPLAIVSAIGIAMLAVFLLSCAIEGYLLGAGVIDPVRRILFAAAALMLFIPETRLDTIGLIAAAVLIFERLLFKQIKHALSRSSGI